MSRTHSGLVKEHFDIKYYDYDALIRKLIPKYEQMHKMVIGQLKLIKKSKPYILDLGIGTGQTALEILRKFPSATIDGYDISQKMIEQGKHRLENHLHQIKFYERDITKTRFTRKYDAVIGVLCIHHLNKKQKKELFSRIYKTIRGNGIFVIEDIVKFDSRKETKKKELGWKQFLIKNLGDRGGNFWFENYLEEDLPDSTKNQLRWLRKIGFNEAKCVWEYMNYSVFYGKK